MKFFSGTLIYRSNTSVDSSVGAIIIGCGFNLKSFLKILNSVSLNCSVPPKRPTLNAHSSFSSIPPDAVLLSLSKTLVTAFDVPFSLINP